MCVDGASHIEPVDEEFHRPPAGTVHDRLLQAFRPWRRFKREDDAIVYGSPNAGHPSEFTDHDVTSMIKDIEQFLANQLAYLAQEGEIWF